VRGRSLPLVLAAAGLLSGGWLLLAPDRAARQAFPPGSAFSAAPDGMSLAFHYLRLRAAAGRRVATLHRPLDLRSVEPGAVVFRVRPTMAARGGAAAAAKGSKPAPVLSRLLLPAEAEWLAAGGRLVMAVATTYGPLAADELQAPAGPKPPATPRKVFPIWPGVRSLAPPVRRGLDARALPTAHAVYLLDRETLVARVPLGRGELIVLACPEVLENAHLGKADHLRLLESLAGAGRPVYLDERVHGLGDSAGALGLLLRWRLGPALALLALAGLAVLWRGRARLGPPEPDPPERRREAVDLVDSLAQLYARALSRREALALYRKALAGAVALRTGLRGAALEARVHELAREAGPPEAEARGAGPAASAHRDDLGHWQFKHALERLNRAFEGVEHG
jgi:hypothetical protein